MRRLAVVLALACSACGEAPAQLRPSVVAQRPVTPAPGDACVSALLLVDKDVSTAAAVDPVETQMALLQSRWFAKGAPPQVNPFGLISAERVGQSALFRLEIHAEPKRAQVTCEWAVGKALAEGRALSQSTRSWLADQWATIQREVEANDQQLKAFDHEHSLLSVPLDALFDMQRSELQELEAARGRGQRGLGPTIQERREGLLRLDVLRGQRQRLSSAADTARALLKATEERQASIELNDMLSPPLRLLDACAPCAAPQTTR